MFQLDILQLFCSVQSDVDDDAVGLRAAVLPTRDVRARREKEGPKEVLPKHDDRWISQVGAPSSLC